MSIETVIPFFSLLIFVWCISSVESAEVVRADGTVELYPVSRSSYLVKGRQETMLNFHFNIME